MSRSFQIRADAIGAAALAAILLAWPVAAGAESAPDSAAPAATGEPRQLPGPDRTQLPADAAPPAATSPIEVAPLGSTEGAPAGLLDASNGGLGSDLWSGTPRTDLEEMVAKLPVASADSWVRELSRRVLLTTAEAPAGAAPHAFLTVRMKSLLDAGFVTEAAILAANAQLPDDPEFARVAADAIFFVGHAGDACGQATAARLQNGDRFWIELRAYCYAMAGDGPALDLTRAVMNSQGMADKAFDILLADAISHTAKDPGAIKDPTSLHVFLLGQAGLPVSVPMAKQLGMPALVLALADEKNPPDQRAEAAEDVLRAGAAPPAQLARLADALPFAPDQIAGAQALAPTLPFFQGQALLRQAAAHEARPDVKSQLVFEAFTLGEKADLLEASADLQSDVAASLAPDETMRDMAPLMGRAEMLAGNADAASRWYDVLDLKSAAGRPLMAAFQVELNLVATNPGRAAEAQTALSMLAEGATAAPPAGVPLDQGFAALALGLYDALGEPIPTDAASAAASLRATAWPGVRPSSEAMSRLAASVLQPGRKGEAIVTILDAIGPHGPADLAPDVTVLFVRALEHEGMADAARGLAIDALLLYRPAQPQAAP